MFPTLLLAAQLSLAVMEASPVSMPVKIEVSVMEEGRVAKSAVTFTADDKKCLLVQVSPKKEVKLSPKVCQDFLEKNKSNLEVPLIPSDLPSSQGGFYEVQVSYGGKNWNRIVRQNQNSLCIPGRKCLAPQKPAAWLLAQSLQDLLKVQ